MFAPVVVVGHPDRAVAVLLDADDLRPTAQFALRAPGEGVAQQPLQLGLVEHAGLRVAVMAVLGAAELGHHPVPGVQQPQPARRTGDRGELLPHARGLEDPADLVVGGDGAREGVEVPVAFQDHRADSAPGEEESGGHAHRSGADDDHRYVLFGTAHLRPLLRVRDGCALLA